MTLALWSAAWLAGIGLGLKLEVAPLPVFFLLLAALPLGALLRLCRLPLWPAVMAGLMLLAFWRVVITAEQMHALAVSDNQPVAIQGQIDSDPEALSQRIKFTLSVEAIDQGSGWQPVSGKTLVYADPPSYLVAQRQPPYFRYGDRLLLQGDLQRPQPIENFDYPGYLESQGISGILWGRQVEWQGAGGNPLRRWIFNLRQRLARNINDALPEPQSALSQALLVGLRSSLTDEMNEDFRRTGTSHLLAISGLNVGLMLLLSLGVASWVIGKQRQLYLLFPLAIIWLYALVSGLPSPVVRAAIMSSVYLLALAIGRPASALPALALAAAIMTGIQPKVLTQVSFQLSFAAVAGMILVMPYIFRLNEPTPVNINPWSALAQWRIARWLVAGLLVSAAATLATWPLVAYNFDQIPLLGVLVTLLALPALPFILVGSLATSVFGLLHPAFAEFFGWLTLPAITYLTTLVEQAPGPTVSGSWAGTSLLICWYLAPAGFLLLPGRLDYARQLRRRFFHASPASNSASTSARLIGLHPQHLALSLAVVGSAIFLGAQILPQPDGRLRVYFFDVGQGDSALIVTPHGRQILIDGGPDADRVVHAVTRAIGSGDRSLDVVVLTHLDADHSGGLLEILSRYDVGVVLQGHTDPQSPLYPRWQATLERYHIPLESVYAGYQLDLDDGVILEVLHPPPKPFLADVSEQNNNGLALRLRYGDVGFLFAADIEAEAESYLARQDMELKSLALKVAHHGSKTSSTPAFLRRVSPSLVVISAGLDNQFGHPHPEVVSRLEQLVGAQAIYQTAEQGAIQFTSDGQRLWVKTER